MFHPECDFLSLANLVAVFGPLCLSLGPSCIQILEYSEDCAEAKLHGATLQAYGSVKFGGHRQLPPGWKCPGAWVRQETKKNDLDLG